MTPLSTHCHSLSLSINHCQRLSSTLDVCLWGISLSWGLKFWMTSKSQLVLWISTSASMGCQSCVHCACWVLAQPVAATVSTWYGLRWPMVVVKHDLNFKAYWWWSWMLMPTMLWQQSLLRYKIINPTKQLVNPIGFLVRSICLLASLTLLWQRSFWNTSGASFWHTSASFEIIQVSYFEIHLLRWRHPSP